VRPRPPAARVSFAVASAGAGPEVPGVTATAPGADVAAALVALAAAQLKLTSLQPPEMVPMAGITKRIV